MQLIVDTNVVVAAILKPGASRNLIFNGGLSLYSPDYLLSELKEHKPEFIKKSGIGGAEFDKVVAIVLGQLALQPTEELLAFEKQAKALTPDHDDWPFLAAALYRRCAIWSNDRRLKGQNKVKIFTTAELIRHIGGTGVGYEGNI